MASEEYCTVQSVGEALGENILRNLTQREVSGTGIAFVDGAASDDTITDSDSGLAVFAAGNTVSITGSASSANNTKMQMTAVVAGTITVPTASVTAETAGRVITLIASDLITSPTWSSTTVTEAIQRASGKMDSYIGKQYDLPLGFTDKPETLIDACVILVKYDLYTRKSGGVPANVERQYDETIEWLKALAKDEVTLGVVDGAEIDVSDTVLSSSGSTDASGPFHRIKGTDFVEPDDRIGLDFFKRRPGRRQS